MIRPEVPSWWPPPVSLENGPQQAYEEALRRRSLHVHPQDLDSWRLLLDEHQGIARARHAKGARRGNDVLFTAVVGELALQLCVARVGGGNAGLKVGRPLLDLVADQPLLGEVDAKEERRECQQRDAEPRRAPARAHEPSLGRFAAGATRRCHRKPPQGTVRLSPQGNADRPRRRAAG